MTKPTFTPERIEAEARKLMAMTPGVDRALGMVGLMLNGARYSDCDAVKERMLQLADTEQVSDG